MTKRRACHDFRPPTWDPPYDPEEAARMPSEQVRARWPRQTQWCEECDAIQVWYASYDHYIAGDW